MLIYHFSLCAFFVVPWSFCYGLCPVFRIHSPIHRVKTTSYHTMFAKLFFAGVATVAAQEATFFLDDSASAAGLFQEESGFQSGIRKVMMSQTAELEKMVAAHPTSLLLQTEIATQKVETLADTINLAADAASVADGLNACNYARAGALEAYANVDRILNGLGGAVGTACGCASGNCAGGSIPQVFSFF